VKATVARFSGDDSDTEDDEGFLSWHYPSLDWNRWYYGDIVGSTMMLSEDEHVYGLEGGWTFDARWSGRLFLMRFDFDRATTYGGLPPVASRHFGDEATIALDFAPADGWTTWLMSSVAMPGSGGRAVQGDRATSELLWSVKHSF